MEEINNAFDENKIKKTIRKAKLKLTLKIIIVSIVVFVVGNYINIKICMRYSEKAYEINCANVELSTPNGYIGESNDILEFLGGSGTYKVAKEIGRKTVILKDGIVLFGINIPMNYTRENGGGYHSSGEWPVSLWENGYKKMRFFHPELKYKEYQNDLENIDNIPDGKIIEMGISFDKSYTINEMNLIISQFQTSKVTWAWLNEFEDGKMSEFKDEVKTYDAKANGIYEYDIVGISINSNYGIDNNEYNKKYDELIERLSKSSNPDYKKLYEEIMKKGKTTADDTRILGVVVQGTKENLSKLRGNSVIKATSIGIVTDNLY